MRKKISKIIITFFIMGGINMGNNVETEQYKNRDEIPKEYKWNLSDIYKSWDEWEKDYKRVEEISGELVKYKGKLNSKDKLLNFFKKNEEADKLSYKLYMYPNMKTDLNSKDREAQEKLQKVEYLFANMGQQLSWVNPEMISVGEKKVLDWSKTKGYEDYKFGLENLFRMQKHILPEKESKLLSYYSQFNSAPRTIYSELITTDTKWPSIKLSTGEEVASTYGNYSKVLSESRNQEDRRKMFEAHYGVFKDKENTIASIYNSILQKNIANKKAYNYNTFLEMFLSGNNIPEDVYLNLIGTVKENTEPLKRYVRLRKEIMGLKEYHTYDGTVNLIDFDKQYTYDEARNLVSKSIEPLGKDYEGKMTKALKDGWIDVYETENKRSGAYSAGVYGVHPYMLLNYNGTMDAVFTLGHELGHTLHTLYSDENQPFENHSYTIFVAEVASTFNERLLLDYMLENTEDPKERIALLEQEIGNIVSTFYFQTLLADYEYQAHKLADEGQPITADTLTNIMKGLFDTYYGDNMVKDELLPVVWARIPHFFNSPFYVYQYATCFASSAVIYDAVIKENDPTKREEARKKYLALLSSGGSDFPMNQLKAAGVDLSKKETIKSVSNQLDILLDKLEKELKALKK